MPPEVTNMAQQHHQELDRQQHEKGLNQTAIEADNKSAELIAAKIASKIDEQNRIIFDIGVRHGRTTFVAYLSLIIAATAVLGQLFGPAQEWTIWHTILDYWNSLKSWVGL